ncbi:hypothetical protein [Pseudorhodobacter sp. E13]|uniref:hypothetical protein n=1 Tax=Pseudorhodobacter sp. E13 TaxID=2487931 RepID=UPI000F8E01F1|nr:hypothetical protein [Pseudorhodobacter sp. E13]
MRRNEQQERQAWTPDVPKEFPAHYALGGYSDHQISRIALKYLARTENIKRAWARIHHHFPETLSGAAPLDILELSTAHGAMLEVWRHFGHRVRGTDFGGWSKDYNKNAKRPKFLDKLTAKSHDNPRGDKNLGWIYQPIIESLGLEVDLFDAGCLPYPYPDKSFDVLCCYQAIEAYAAPEHWGTIADEFCRIARQSIVIGFNPPAIKLREDEAHMAIVREATEALRSFNRNGFKCVFMEFGETRAGFHPTAVKLMACAPAATGKARPKSAPALPKNVGAVVLPKTDPQK